MPVLISPVRGVTAALFLALAFAIGAAALWALSASGADHRDGPAAEANAPLDITDVYAFRSPAAADNLVVAFGVNGLTAPSGNSAARFNADATYTIHVDTDGDLADNATANFDFDGSTPQKFTVTGLGNPINGEVTPAGQAAKITEAGGIKAFAGLRDDPFFFDLTAFKKFVAGPYVPAAGLRAAADGAPADTFAGTNVTYMILELPITAVTGAADSHTGTIKAWANTTNGGAQLDRMAIPAINTALIPAAMKDDFNKGAPATDATAFRPTAQTTMQSLRDAVNAVLNGPVGAEDGGPLGNLTSAQVAEALIPDIVTIDFTKDVAFPNGRSLTDDVIDTALQLVLNRTAGVTDAINANDKSFGSAFPYLADPAVEVSSLPATGGQPAPNDGVDTTLLLAIAGLGVALMVGGTGLVVGRRAIG
ncbi:MAG: DUF4331 family protein [Dehalococcoidia bacterium]